MILPRTLFGVLAVTVGLVGCQDAQYPKAISLIRIRPVEADGKPATSESYARFCQTQIALVKSPYVLNAVLRKPGITQLGVIQGTASPVDWLSQHLQVRQLQNSEIFEVSMRGEAEKEMIQLVGAVVASYLDEIAHAERADMTGKLDTLRSKERDYIRMISEKSKTVNELAKELGVASGKSEITRQYLQQQAELAHRRVENLTVQLDNLTVQVVAGKELGVSLK